jgi:NADH dehydrogenase/NADH:ubiquinone oxidoreductase subunit G
MTPFKDANADIADVLLPVAPFTETGGTFVNAEGRVQSFHGVVKPLGETRPAWKVLRVLGNLLGCRLRAGTVEEVRAEALGAMPLRARASGSHRGRAIAVPPSRRRPGARRRRADLRHRPARAPRAVAAGHGGRRGAGRRACPARSGRSSAARAGAS